MSLDTSARIALIPPKHGELRWRWDRALNSADLSFVRVTSRSDAESYLHDERTRAYVLFGDRAWRDIIGDDRQLKDALRNKLVYRFGGTPKAEASALLKAGLGAFIGNDDDMLLVFPDGPLELLFFQPLIAALKSVQAGHDVKQVAERIRMGWREIARNPDALAHTRGPFIRMFALSHYEHVFTAGDVRWQFTTRPSIVVLDHFDDDVGNDATDEAPRAPDDELRIRDLVPRVELIDISPLLFSWLRTDPTRIHQLSADQFEQLVANRLRAMNFSVEQVGSTYTSDGGIDFLAVPQDSPLSFLVAVQVKHSQSDKTIGSPAVRDLSGVLANQPIDLGLIVTNTRFSPDAKWFAKNARKLIRLRDFLDFQRWLQEEFVDNEVYDELPESVTLGPNLTIRVPRPKRSTGSKISS